MDFILSTTLKHYQKGWQEYKYSGRNRVLTTIAAIDIVAASPAILAGLNISRLIGGI